MKPSLGRTSVPFSVACCGSLAIAALLLPSSGYSQAGNSKQIPSEPSCPRCQIIPSIEIRLGAGDTTISQWPEGLWRDYSGRYYLTQPNKGELPLVFSRAGRLIARLGRSGEGPGEFRGASLLVGDAQDTLFVVDFIGRISVFAPNLKFVRSAAFPRSVRSLAILGTGKVVVNSSTPDRNSVGLPFQVYNRDGTRAAALGDSARPYRAAFSYMLFHRVARSKAGGFWAVPFFGELRLERWLENGARASYLVQKPEWYVGMNEAREGIDPLALDPPASMVEAVWEDVNGLVWVVVRVGDPARKQAPTDTVRTREGKFVVPTNADKSWDTFVEVIDPVKGQLVVSRRFDEAFRYYLGEGRMANVQTGKEGFLTIAIVSFALRRP